MCISMFLLNRLLSNRSPHTLRVQSTLGTPFFGHRYELLRSAFHGKKLIPPWRLTSRALWTSIEFRTPFRDRSATHSFKTLKYGFRPNSRLNCVTPVSWYYRLTIYWNVTALFSQTWAGLGQTHPLEVPARAPACFKFNPDALARRPQHIHAEHVRVHPFLLIYSGHAILLYWDGHPFSSVTLEGAQWGWPPPLTTTTSAVGLFRTASPRSIERIQSGQ